jgi:hypothetical protein
VLEGAMWMWWILTIPSFLFVTIDIFITTPEATVMKWAFVILTAFTGPVGAFFYVLGCREPIRGTHEQYVSVRWRQVLGSTMHCAAGDGIGIIVGAAIGAALTLSFWPDFLLEYALGFSFGWAYFQAFAMRDMAGGDYLKSLRMTFLPEFVSMNCLMAGMLLVSKFWMPNVAGGGDPSTPEFWFIMSMSLIAGFAFAYPMNWWLVSNHMKHGMITVLKKERELALAHAAPSEGSGMTHAEHMGASIPAGAHGSGHDSEREDLADMAAPSASRGLKGRMVAVSLGVLAVSLWIITTFAPGA